MVSQLVLKVIKMDKRILIAILSLTIFFVINIQYISPSSSGYVIWGHDLIYMDEMPIAEYPHDLAYIYLGKSHINLTVINFNDNYNFTYVSEKFTSEFERANMTFTYHFLWVNESANVFRITYLINLLWRCATENYSNTNLVLVFTGEYAVSPNIPNNEMVIGGAYVENHVGFVFRGIDEEHRVYVGMHEVGHLLGLVHTSDYNDIMYPEYHGQEHFGVESIAMLEKLHD